MHEFCHICGGELPATSGETPFCPHCGAPQLTLALDYQNSGEPTPTAESTGMRPPPRPQQVDWQMAIRCAVAVAAVGGLLSIGAMRLPLLTPASVLWVFSGSLITLGLYQNRRPLAWMDARTGARIGVLVGLCLALGLAIPLSIAGLVARFGLHTMGGFDAELSARFASVVQQSKTPITADEMRLIQSQEFRAANVLFTGAVGAMILLALSAVGGAFGGLLRTRRKAAV